MHYCHILFSSPDAMSLFSSRISFQQQSNYFYNTLLVSLALESITMNLKVFKWALESITTNKATGGDGIPVELFQILKDDAVSVALNMPANLENSAVATGLEKVSFHSNPKERQCQRMIKLPHNCTHLTRW